jgi:ferredoxin-NADP reductase
VHAAPSLQILKAAKLSVLRNMDTTILSVREEAQDTVTIRLALALPYIAGQHIMLGVPLDGTEFKRSYSVASVHNGEWVETSIKKQEPGLVSKLAQKWKAGERLRLYGPFGKAFTFNPESADPSVPIVLLAAGSGITPFRAFALAAQKHNWRGSITLIDSARTQADIFYRAERQTWPLRVVTTLTRPTDVDRREWEGAFGRISPPLVRDVLGEQIVTAKFFIAGPTAFVVDMMGLLRRLDVDLERVRTEKFGLIQD